MSDRVRTSAQGGVLVITLDRPEVRNAIDGETARLLTAALRELDSSPRLLVGVLTGAGGTFCSGMDLKAFAQGDPAELAGRSLGNLTRELAAKPLIAAVEGWALGGGFELMLACDLAVASATARFGLPEVKRGLVAAGGGALRLPRRLPAAVAMELLLTGEPMLASQAAQFGLVSRLVPAGQALTAAMQMADLIAQNSPLAVRATKAIALRSYEGPQSDEWAAQKLIADPILASEDAREGAAAFAAKRNPVWQGR
jgi:enoyl-CoA hydratase